MTRAELDTANLTLRARLGADGWLAGREVYRTEQEQQVGESHDSQSDLAVCEGLFLNLRQGIAVCIDYVIQEPHG